MYKFVFQNDKTDIEVILTQAMLVVAAVAIFVYRPAAYPWVGYIAATILLLTALLIRIILNRLPVNKWMLLGFAALILLLSTWQLYFPLVLLVYGALIKFLIKAPELEITDKGVSLKTVFSTKNTPWTDFNSVQIKDGLLVLDYKNNQVKYLTFTETVHEASFNSFCAGNIAAANS